MPEFEIQLRDIMLYGRHGVLPEERITGNQYRINVRLHIDASGYDEFNDDLATTVSYADVYEILKQIMSVPSALLETVAVRFGKAVVTQWHNVKSGEIEIVKNVPPISDMIGEAGVKYSF
ncbi:MAG: dihydroneopterin aldolase [Muribaculaceae bacterium]|nr:dihydroneopterin aldolase [Muribaculaceae bacterium]